MEQKEKLLTIGQFAAMHGINKKTLMWYDEIGLFAPAAIILKTDTAAMITTRALFSKRYCYCGNWMSPFGKSKIL